MENQPIKELVKNLEHELIRLNYKEATLGYYRQLWARLIVYFEQQGKECFSEEIAMKYIDERYNFFEKEKAGQLTQGNVYAFRVVRMLGDFQLHGTILRRYHNSLQRIHNDQFITLLENYVTYCKSCGYSKVTQNHYRKGAGNLFAFLESQNVNQPLEITARNIADYVNTLLGYSYKTVELALCALRSLLRFLHLNGHHVLNLSEAIPQLKSRKQNRIPSVWSQDDVIKLIDSIDRGNPSGKRDYAIILLVTRLGIRTIDVKHLKLENLKWNSNQIEFVQSKTSQKISLPLLKDVGWAIIDYLQHGRPKVDSPYVFLRHLAPIEEFSDEDRLHQIITKYMKIAKIPIYPKKKIGMHSLRHTLASFLLEKHTPLSTISEILGHVSTDSTAVYLKSNIESLRECALNPEEVQ